ncbi:hypothetical protein UCRPC4_g00344 [Phaeomoniella chlamydospora]|uniref:Uncharacterized protein n=1 Tax=Phaeomoniella chlamydospora TaxID=158046 RepID=A0A0G2HKK3_PHACM|nr:hypothetical protein UCRPC4_g00344 [Phaeomoniella chlamydospora]
MAPIPPPPAQQTSTKPKIRKAPKAPDILKPMKHGWSIGKDLNKTNVFADRITIEGVLEGRNITTPQQLRAQDEAMIIKDPFIGQIVPRHLFKNWGNPTERELLKSMEEEEKRLAKEKKQDTKSELARLSHYNFVPGHDALIARYQNVASNKLRSINDRIKFLSQRPPQYLSQAETTNSDERRAQRLKKFRFMQKAWQNLFDAVTEHRARLELGNAANYDREFDHIYEKDAAVPSFVPFVKKEQVPMNPANSRDRRRVARTTTLLRIQFEKV